MKQYEVAVIVDENGEVIGALKCKMVDEKEYANIMSENARTLAKEKLEKKNLYKTIGFLQEEINDLKHEIKVLKGE